MADVAALTGDEAYVNAIDTIWSNCVGKKIYLTGGIGARADGEAFGEDYDLPNLTPIAKPAPPSPMPFGTSACSC